MRSLIALVLSLAFLSAVTETRGGELASPKGFTITYPEGWQQATKEEFDLIAKSAGSRAALFVAFLHGPRSGNFADNVNVLVLPAALTLDDKGEKELIEGVKGGLAKTATNFSTKRIEINGAAAVSMAYEVEGAAASDPMRIWQVYIPGKKQVYVFTCTTLKPRWADVWPAFKQMIYSVRIDVVK